MSLRAKTPSLWPLYSGVSPATELLFPKHLYKILSVDVFGVSTEELLERRRIVTQCHRLF